MSDLNRLAADCQCVCHNRICELRCACALSEEVDAASVCQIAEALCLFFRRSEGCRIQNNVSAACLSQFYTLRNALDCDQLACAGSLHQLDCCQTDRAASEYTYMSARTYAFAADKQTVVSNTCRLDHRAKLECCHLVAAIVLSDRVQRIAVFLINSCILCEAAVIGKSRLFQIKTLVEETTSAGVALAAPVHGLDADQIADFELLDIFTNFYDLTGELMACDDRIFAVSVIHGVTFFILTKKMYICSADTCCTDFHHNLGVAANRHRTIYDRTADVLPDLVAAKGSACGFLTLRKHITRLRAMFSFNIKSSHLLPPNKCCVRFANHDYIILCFLFETIFLLSALPEKNRILRLLSKKTFKILRSGYFYNKEIQDFLVIFAVS